jgi:ParB-like chromosome segregation protein Spo0J
MKTSGGLLQPIGITEDRWLVFGRHRLRAAQILGWERIPARIMPYRSDSPQARIDEIDENVVRRTLTALELSEAMAARKAAWLELHPETGHGKRPKKQAAKSKVAKLATLLDEDSRPVPTLAEMVDVPADETAQAFAADTAKKTGKSPRTVRRAASIGERLDPQVAEQIASTPIADKQAELEKLARLEPDMQRTVATMLVEGEVQSVTEALADSSDPEPEPAEEASTVLRGLLDAAGLNWRAKCGDAATAQLGAAVLESLAEEWIRQRWEPLDKKPRKGGKAR